MTSHTVLGTHQGADRSPTKTANQDLAGATFGHFAIIDEYRTPRRWAYRVIDKRTGEDVKNVHGKPARLGGHELVRLVRLAEAEGLSIIMPNGEPWANNGG